MLHFLSQPPDGKENILKTEWESQLDTLVLEQSRQKILQVLNTGSLKDLKGLQQIGDKKAKLILGWREIHGHFTKVSAEKSLTREKLVSGVCGIAFRWVCDDYLTVKRLILQLEELVGVEGMTAKRFSSFMKVSRRFRFDFHVSQQ